MVWQSYAFALNNRFNVARNGTFKTIIFVPVSRTVVYQPVALLWQRVHN